VFSLLAGISAPVFNAGRIRSNIAAQDALLEQSRLAYQAAVLAALEDVENALVALAHLHQRQQELQNAVVSARESWQLTQHRYSAGLGDFQAVLESQRTLLNIENLLAGNTADISRAQVQLYKAMGGGWQGSTSGKPDDTANNMAEDELTENEFTKNDATHHKEPL
jgi:outer membrane protein TolC